ncbi:MAG: sugar phosphate isomerase/epimerase [Armatimonadetes bacterium]|nr:sugar phosphate isomerase/epimerase [Armatimonadota bacterium]
MTLGLLTYNMAAEWDLDTLLEKCNTFGLKGAEFRTDVGHAHGVEIDTSPSERKTIREKCEDANVTIIGLSSGCAYDAIDQQELAENIERTKRHLDMCAEVGGGGVKVFGNKLHVDEGVPEQQTVQQIGEALHECAEYARELGVLVRFEMHGDFQTAEQCNEIIRLADSEGICLIYNCNPNDPKDGSIREIYSAVAPNVGHVHLHDLSDRNFPYLELVKLLRETGYSGWCTTELPDSTDRDRVLGYYVALWEAYLKIAELESGQ